MLDAEARTLLDLMDKAFQEGRPKLHTLSYAEGRAAVDKMLEDSKADPPEVAAVEDCIFAGPAGAIRYRRYRPLGSPGGPLPTLIYYHGGGFVAGTLETHDSTCRRLANKSRRQVIAIDYRLSPEHPFTAPTDDGIAAFRYIRAHTGGSGGKEGDRGNAGQSLQSEAWPARQEEQRFVRLPIQLAERLTPIIESIRAEGANTLRSMAAELNRRGFKSPRGGKWHPSSVANLLARAT
jgi:hypothetical protein